MAAGVETLHKAVDIAVKDFLEKGICSVRYRDGRQVNIASYAEMALRTANTRAMLLGEGQKRQRLGIDTVLVSEYGACSDTCLPWQGLVYIDDVWQPYSGTHTPGGTYGVSVNGRSYPLLSVAVKAGLFHPNCRHTVGTWIEGVSTRPAPMDKKKIERTSKLEAHQRAMERAVRRYKRLAAGTQDEAKAREYKAKARAAQAKLREFVNAHPDELARDPWRERLDLPQEQKRDTLKAETGYNIPVTEEAIERVPKLPSTYWLDDEKQEALRRENQALLRAAAKEPLGTEVARVYDMNMQPLSGVLIGKPGAGRIAIPDYNQPYIVAHTHPDGLALSKGDVEQFPERPNMRAIDAAGHNGKVYLMERLPQAEQPALVKQLNRLDEDVKKIQTLDEAVELMYDFYERVKPHGFNFYEG